MPLDQLDQVKKVLDRAGLHYHVAKYALSYKGGPYIVKLSLEHRADDAAIQRLLDDFQDPEVVEDISAAANLRLSRPAAPDRRPGPRGCGAQAFEQIARTIAAFSPTWSPSC